MNTPASLSLPSKTRYATTPISSDNSSEKMSIRSSDPKNTVVKSDGNKTMISLSQNSPRSTMRTRITPTFSVKKDGTSSIDDHRDSSSHHGGHHHHDEYAHAHHEHSLEKHLLSHGYLVDDYIVDQGKVHYVRARDVNGNVVLVELDEATKRVSPKMNDSRKMSHTVDVIPSQRKASLMDCIRHQAKGIAVDNNDTYCILSRKNDNHLEMKEMTFKRDGDVASLNDFSVAYPIVLLSDITADDKLTAKNTHEVMNRLYREHYQSLSDIISSHKNQVYELYKTVDEIDNKQKMIVSRISEALSLLEEKSSEYDTFSLLSDDDKKNYFRLQKNMIAHHDYLMKLLDTLSTLKLADEKLHKLSESAKHLSQMLDADYQRVGLRHDE